MAKKEKKKKESNKLYTLYEVSGDAVNRKNSFCLKCGPGFYLAKHQGRTTCGRCGYTEFESKAPKPAENIPEKAEEKKVEIKPEEVEAAATDTKLDIKADTIKADTIKTEPKAESEE